MPSPSVMLSSTFYDLRQIRADLRDFLESQLGYTVLASEYPSFPVDPDAGTVENCRRRVMENADVLVLVVGGRYGSVDNVSNKSVTNLEYLTARGKGIPIYVFIEKQVLNLFPIWRSNPDADFSNVVDSSRLFEFIHSVRESESRWTFSFETSQNIVDVLRIQLGHLFASSLQSHQHFRNTEARAYLSRLSPQSLRIALERSDAWPYRLFTQCWIDEVDARRELVWEYDEGLCSGVSDGVSRVEAPDWSKTRLKEIENLISSANRLISDSAPSAFGKSEDTADVERIIWVTRQLGIIFEQIIRWSQRVREARVEEPFEKVARELSRIPTQPIREFKSFPVECLARIEESLKNPTADGSANVKMTMIFDVENAAEISQAMAEARRRLGEH